MKYLDYANGWGEDKPEEYVKHKEAVDSGEKHDIEEREFRRVSTITCKTCGITWKVDHS